MEILEQQQQIIDQNKNKIEYMYSQIEQHQEYQINYKTNILHPLNNQYEQALTNLQSKQLIDQSKQKGQSEHKFTLELLQLLSELRSLKQQNQAINQKSQSMKLTTRDNMKEANEQILLNKKLMKK